MFYSFHERNLNHSLAKCKWGVFLPELWQVYREKISISHLPSPISHLPSSISFLSAMIKIPRPRAGKAPPGQKVIQTAHGIWQTEGCRQTASVERWRSTAKP